MGKLSDQQQLKIAPLVIENSWQKLKQFTSARIALGRSGNSIPTIEQLSFQLDHARAIDAVHKALDVEKLVQQLSQSKILREAIGALPIVVSSKAQNRMIYLQRPDLGRQLSEVSRQSLIDIRAENSKEYDLAIVIADGLSSTAIQTHALPVIEKVVEKLVIAEKYDWSIAPITIITQGRVASGDDVGECLKAKITIILIGERPGLTSPDSMGMYMTWAPKRGAKDSSRNCISNIRPAGLNYEQASDKAVYLLRESIKLQISGITLKDRSQGSDHQFEVLEPSSTKNFLLSSKR
ncbi:ethanolamine ammonia-lyase subunit EutC [Paraglaciecola sp. L3A3]|uniref:ethanolamine ammonia-lyase subunit EutC n=1 Tax=Paraglaciecola sp. L3A3 TaxID=2686358 RepID=UPI00131C321C|nr:ethanolamine ammonia-lyase subunit EutC [Paraglaciecola sp. L3A3]